MAYCWVLRVLCIFWATVLYKTCFANILSQCVAYLFILLMVSFAVFNFNEVWLNFSFMDHAFSVTSKKSSPNPRSSKFSSTLSSRSFIVLHFTLMAIIYLILTQLHWVAFVLLSKISWLYLCGSSPGLSVLFHWSICLQLSYLFKMGHTFQFFNILSNSGFILDIWNQAESLYLLCYGKPILCFISLKSVGFFLIVWVQTANTMS